VVGPCSPTRCPVKAFWLSCSIVSSRHDFAPNPLSSACPVLMSARYTACSSRSTLKCDLFGASVCCLCSEPLGCPSSRILLAIDDNFSPAATTLVLFVHGARRCELGFELQQILAQGGGSLYPKTHNVLIRIPLISRCFQDYTTPIPPSQRTFSFQDPSSLLH